MLDAAQELLEDRSWSEISLEEIAATAEVARTAFYRYFEDRQQLLNAILDDVGLELEHVAVNWWQDSGDSITDLRRSLAGLTKIFAEHGRLLQAISDTARYDPDMGRRYQALADRLIAATTERIEKDIEQGASRVSEPREVAAALIWMNERYLLASFGRAPLSDPDVVTRALAVIWVGALYGPDVV
ncbi:TetR/AcrR family transcriptional regulator [Nocardia sp. NPDC059691]|uniref:TetR/AcrR family transcriptional regulator n=1 Tax=Nocardia sp. NPDC059691 TaxID=3346908 RepID=UPI0002FB11E7